MLGRKIVWSKLCSQRRA